jgi:hypothetical protein
MNLNNISHVNLNNIEIMIPKLKMLDMEISKEPWFCNFHSKLLKIGTKRGYRCSLRKAKLL